MNPRKARGARGILSDPRAPSSLRAVGRERLALAGLDDDVGLQRVSTAEADGLAVNDREELRWGRIAGKTPVGIRHLDLGRRNHVSVGRPIVPHEHGDVPIGIQRRGTEAPGSRTVDANIGVLHVHHVPRERAREFVHALAGAVVAPRASAARAARAAAAVGTAGLAGTRGRAHRGVTRHSTVTVRVAAVGRSVLVVVDAVVADFVDHDVDTRTVLARASAGAVAAVAIAAVSAALFAGALGHAAADAIAVVVADVAAGAVAVVVVAPVLVDRDAPTDVVAERISRARTARATAAVVAALLAGARGRAGAVRTDRVDPVLAHVDRSRRVFVAVAVGAVLPTAAVFCTAAEGCDR